LPIEAQVNGACFGFAVRSGLPFALLRQGDGTPLLIDESDGSEPAQIGRLVREWPAEPGGGLTTRLHALDDVDQFWLERVGWFRIESTVPAISLPKLPAGFGSALWRESIMWGTPAAVCAVRRGLISIHAAAVEVDGMALVLAAPGTYGKTTLSGAFMQAGYRLLSDDIVCCQRSPVLGVFPGPAILRLRRDVFERLDFTGIATAHDFGRKTGLVLNASRRGDARPIPLAGIVLLRRSSGDIKISPVDPPAAIRDLFALSFKGVLDQGRSFEDLAALVSAVPVWNLERRLEFDNLPHVIEALVRTCVAARHA
jgi:hypothetical protein